MWTDVAVNGSAIRFGLGALALLAIWRFVVVRTLTEELRQKVFGLRRELFCFMADGHIDPKTPAYVELWSTLNGFLRSTETVRLGRLLLAWAFFGAQIRAYAAHKEAQLKELDAVAREKLTTIDRDLAFALLQYIAFTSPIAWAFFVVLTMGAVLFVPVMGVRGLMNRLLVRTRALELEIPAGATA